VAFSKPKAHERAERYAAKGQHDKAAREYQSIVEHDPKDVRAWLMLADCLVRTGDKAGAVDRYIRVAEYYVEAKEHNKALAVYGQVLNLDRQRLDIQTKVAALNVQLGRVPDGVAVYERVAQAHMQAGRVAEAINVYRIVADADPSAVARRLRLAELYSREKRKDEAVEAFREAARQLRESGRPADYVRVAERLLYHDDTDLVTIRELARAYLELGDPRRALMKLNGLLRANNKDEEGIELLAETFMALGKPEKALSALEELARGLKARGPAAKADSIRILRRGLEWRPAHAEFREALAELEGRRSSAQPIEPPPADDDVEELETLDEDDLVELDEDDLVMEEPDEPGAVDDILFPEAPPAAVELPEAGSTAPGTRRTTEIEAIPSMEPSLTQSVLSEVETAGADIESLTDFDKILFEARVYIKYRLFDHALDHVQAALNQQPEHLGALSLQARVLTELGRTAQAADVHIRVAQMVMARDPKLAREHVGAARQLVPDHPLLAQLGEALAEAAAPARPVPGAGDDGDSGAVDLVSVAPPDESEPPANLVSAHDMPAIDEGPSTQPFTPIDIDIVDDDEDDEPQTLRPASRRPIIVDEDELEPAQTGRTLLPYAATGPGADGAPSQPPARTGRTQTQMPAMGDQPSARLGDLDLGAGEPESVTPEVSDPLEIDLDDAIDLGPDSSVPDLGAAFDGLGAPEPELEPDPSLELDIEPDPTLPPEPARSRPISRPPSSEPVGSQPITKLAASRPTGSLPAVGAVAGSRPARKKGLDSKALGSKLAGMRRPSKPRPVSTIPVPAEAVPPEPASAEAASPEPSAAESAASAAASAAAESAAESAASAAASAAAESAAASQPGAAAPSGRWPDLSDDLAEIRFYVDQGLDDDAEAALDDLESRYPGHPAIARFRGKEVQEEPAAAAVLVEAEAAEPLVDLDIGGEDDDADVAAEPLVSFEDEDDDDEDAYLSAIFAAPTERAKPKSGGVSSAGANLAEGQAVDAATAFDLGVAYREMGLVDAAITQFETAAADPQWRARALIMQGTLRVHQGDTNQAIANLNEAATLANTHAETSEAAYELGVLYEMLGDVGSAIAQFLQVDPGFRDRDERLAQLEG